MQVRTGVETLAVVLSIILLAANGAEGLEKCELRTELSDKLPTNVLNFIESDMATFICSVELMSGFKTSLVMNITVPEKHYGPRYARSVHESSSVESNEKQRKPKRGGTSTTVRPTTVTQGSTSSAGSSSGPRVVRSVEDSNTENNRTQPTFSSKEVHPTDHPRGNPFFFFAGRGPRRTRGVKMASPKSSEHTSGTRVTAKPPCTNSTSSKSHSNRRVHKSSTHKSSMESGSDDVRVNSTFTGPQGNDSSSERGHGKRHGRSIHKFSLMAQWSSRRDSDEKPEIKPTREPIVQPRTKASEEPSEESSKESSEESHEESSEESSQKSHKESSEESSPKSHEESSEESSQKSHEESSEESSQKSHEKSSEESHEGSLDKSHEEPNKDSNSESNEGSADGFFEGFSETPITPHPDWHIPRHVRSSESDSSPEADGNVWTLYGLFQLPGHITCTSGSEPTLNLCNMSCDDLLNEDIADDIACVGTIISKMIPMGMRPVLPEFDIQELLEVFQKKECADMKNSQYFSGC